MNYKTAAYCSAGESNRRAGMECQDQSGYINQDGIVAVVLSDGAGSKAFSAMGAKIVVEQTIKALQETMEEVQQGEKQSISVEQEKAFQELLKEKILQHCKEALEQQPYSINDMAATLVFVAASSKFCIWGNIGDGIIIQTNTNGIKVLSEGENGEYSNQTYFVTDRCAKAHFQMGMIKEFDKNNTFLLMTDGISKSFYNKRNGTVSSVCEQMQEWMEQYDGPQVEEILAFNVEEYLRQRTKDDIGIGILHCN